MKPTLLEGQGEHGVAVDRGWVDTKAARSLSWVEMLANDTGAEIPEGSVVVVQSDGTIALAATLNDPRPTGVVLDDIDDGDKGMVSFGGPVKLVLVTGAVTAGQYGQSSTTPGQAQVAGSPGNAFCEFTTSGTTPRAFLWGGRGGGGMVVDTLPGSFKLSGVISPAQLTADTDNWNPTGLADAAIIRASTDASRNLTGLQGGSAGRVIILHNVGANLLVLKHDTTSTAANRFYTPGSADVSLGANATAMLIYDATSSRWRVFAASTGGGSSIDGTEGGSTVISGISAVDAGNGLDASNPSGTVLRLTVDPSEIKLDDLGTPNDNTDLDASTSAHGLLPKLPGGTTTFLRGDGTYAAPTALASSGYVKQRIFAPAFNLNDTIRAIDSASYVTFNAVVFAHDFDVFPATSFRISTMAAATESGQTVKLQLAEVATPATAYSAAGNDLTVTNNGGVSQYLDSGWVAINGTKTGTKRLCVAFKGSNASVDIQGRWLDVEFKY